MACTYADKEDAVAKACNSEAEQSASLVRGGPVSLGNPELFGHNSLQEQSEILIRLENLIDQARRVDLEKQRASRNLQNAPSVPTLAMANGRILSAVKLSQDWRLPQKAPTVATASPVAMATDSVGSKMEMYARKLPNNFAPEAKEDRSSSLVQGGPLPHLLGSPAHFLETLGKFSVKEQAEMVSRLEKSIDQETMAELEKHKASRDLPPTASVTLGSRRKSTSNRRLCTNTRLVRAVRSRPYRLR